MRRAGHVLGGITGCLLASSLLACERLGTLGDQGAPDGPELLKVLKKCERMEFDATKASAVQALDADGTVLVRIIPATRSSRTKLPHLVSRKGRVIAKVVNEGTTYWEGMALSPNGSSCWFVWGDKEGRMHSKFVSLNDSTEAPDRRFDIEFHSDDHREDKSEWNPPDRNAMSDRGSLFQLAAFAPRPRQLVFNTGWTTCLINGCCRSRQ